MAGCERAEESQHLGPPQLATQHDLSVRTCGVDLKHTLGKVKADGDNLLHGWRLCVGSNDNPTMAHRDAGSRSHPPRQWRINERPCTPASGWDCASGRHRFEPGGAGQIENQVGNVREWLFTPTPRFADFAALNAWLATRCRELGARRHPTQDATIAEIFALEQPMLQPVSMPFDACIELPPNLRNMARLQHVPRNGRPQSLQRSGRMGRQTGLGPHQRTWHQGRGRRRACRPA